jgi:hypothetical protein
VCHPANEPLLQAPSGILAQKRSFVADDRPSPRATRNLRDYRCTPGGRSNTHADAAGSARILGAIPRWTPLHRDAAGPGAPGIDAGAAGPTGAPIAGFKTRTGSYRQAAAPLAPILRHSQPGPQGLDREHSPAGQVGGSSAGAGASELTQRPS